MIERNIEDTTQEHICNSVAVPRRSVSPLLLFLVMEGVLLLLDSVLPLPGLEFSTAFPAKSFEALLLLPAQLLFSGRADFLPQFNTSMVVSQLPSIVALNQSLLFFGVIALLFICYMLTVRLLPRRVGYRYIFLSTLLIGLPFTLFPIVTSQDLFSYISYARMQAIYHVNPLVTSPNAIWDDPIYRLLFWVHQPSAYGPTWILISSLLQRLALSFGFSSVSAMILLLRLFGLVVHMASVQLIWLISGNILAARKTFSSHLRLSATLAFAWNPLLLFEAVANAHNDATIVFLVLLALWLLLLPDKKNVRPYVLATVTLALAACLKVTLLLLFPILLLYLVARGALRYIPGILVIYAGVVLLLYLPFWDNGSILHILKINPGTTRDFGSPYEFVFRLYNSLHHIYVPLASVDIGTRVEILTHHGSEALLVATYTALCLYGLLRRQLLSTPAGLISCMAATWLLYCVIGSPWFWPWYAMTFFGLDALMRAINAYPRPIARILKLPLASELLAFGLLSVYGFSTRSFESHYLPYIYNFQWAYLRGIWPWLLPLVALRISFRFSSRHRNREPDKRLVPVEQVQPHYKEPVAT